MKKIVSILSALALLTAMPMNAFAAENDYSELEQLASSLGADTDYLAVLNYSHGIEEPQGAKTIEEYENWVVENPFTLEQYNDYLHSCSLIEAANSPYSTFYNAIKNGSCIGISILEILSHNGVISPSDIQSGAETLSEITYNETSDRYITAYQTTQAFTEFNNYEKYLITSMSYDEEIDALMSTAEKCMKDNKYFLITVRGTDFSHAVCGMGITDGNWKFNGSSYDKCILVLDSNNADSEGNPAGFSGRNCIYINSKTKESCLPAYGKYSESDSELTFAAIDDDTLLNYKGMINRSEKIDTDVSDIRYLFGRDSKWSKITPIDSDGNALEIPEEGYRYMKAAGLKAEMREEEDPQYLRLVNSDRWISLEIERKRKHQYIEYNCDAYVTDNKVGVVSKDGGLIETAIDIRMNKGSFGFDPYYHWDISGKVAKAFEAEVCDDGMLFKPDGNIETYVMVYYYTTDDEGDYLSVHQNSNRYTYLNINNNVMVKFGEGGKYEYYLDDNKDGVYDVKVKTGDINCDGKLDARDASTVLFAYGMLSTSIAPESFDFSIGDISGDGRVNSIDASDILAEYSKNATSYSEPC